MADVETVELLAWMDTLPAPTDDSRWDGIFLCPVDQRDFAIMLGWFWATHIHPEGELYQSFVGP